MLEGQLNVVCKLVLDGRKLVGDGCMLVDDDRRGLEHMLVRDDVFVRSLHVMLNHD